MKLKVDKDDLSWLHKNGFVSVEQVSVLWDQLSQRCDVADGSSAWNPKTTDKLQIPQVAGECIGIEKSKDICVVYSLRNGEKLAQSVQKRIARRKKKVCLAYGSSGVFDPKETEKVIASSSALVVLLTEACLRQVEVVFALNVAKFYYEHPSLVILVHDAESCFFPGYDEQPESVKDFFSEKAVTFLNCYPEIGITEIVNKFDDEMKVLGNILENYKQKPSDALYSILVKHENRKQIPVSEVRKRLSPFIKSQQLEDFIAATDKNKDGTIDTEELQEALDGLKQQRGGQEQGHHHEDVKEDLTTRLFLSHKRSTGQGIAGRLYEGLKSDYAIFIDSEAKFKIHNLKLIVQKTDVFVFILSYGILLSKWCLEELKSAVENKKRVIVVRELSFKLPSVLPDEWKEVEPVIRNSPELIWLAEYNTACVNALKTFIGSPDQDYRYAEQFIETEDGKKVLDAVLTKFQNEKILDLNDSIPIPSPLKEDALLDIILRSVPAEKITALQIRAPDEVQKAIYERLPFIQELKTLFSNENTLKEALMLYPSLKKLTVMFSELTTSLQSAIADAPELEDLDLSLAIMDYGVGIEMLTSGCLSVETLKIQCCSQNAEIFPSLPKFPKLKEVFLPLELYGREETKQFEAKHPGIKFTFKPKFVDFNTYSGTGWLPGIIMRAHNARSVTVHGYCNTFFREKVTDAKMDIDPFLSHQHEYISQSGHEPSRQCTICNFMHPLLEHVKFDGVPNVHFIDKWFHEAEWGKEAIDKMVSTAKEGYLHISKVYAPGNTAVSEKAIAKVLFEKVNANSITELYWEDEAMYVVPWLQVLPNLKVLSLKKWDRSSGSSAEIAKCLPESLEELGITSIASHRAACALAERTTRLPNFHTLRISEESDKMDWFKEFFTENNKLKTISIHSCTYMNRTILTHIAKTSRQVAELDITLCPQVKGNCVDILTKEFPSLKKLTVDLLLSRSQQFKRPDQM